MSNLAPAVGFFVKVFEVLATSPTPIGISEISRRTEINKTMVSRILNTLEEEKWIQCDEKLCYSLTLLPFRLSSMALTRITLVNSGNTFLQKFWKEYGECTYLGILYHDEVLYLLHYDSLQRVRVAGRVGESYPLYCTAPGKVLLAFSDEDYIEEYLSDRVLKRYTDTTLTKPDEIKKELRTIRERGYALDNEELGKGTVCIAAPIYDYTQSVIGVVGCSLSTVYCSVDEVYDRCGAKLVQTADQISRSLGYIPS